MNEGMLGKFSFGGERAATDDHPGVLHHLPLSATGKGKALEPGTLMKRVAGEGTDTAYEPYLSTDAETVIPCAVVNTPCDPTGAKGETSALCVVHGTVKTRLLKTGDAKAPTGAQLAKLMQSGIFAA